MVNFKTFSCSHVGLLLKKDLNDFRVTFFLCIIMTVVCGLLKIIQERECEGTQLRAQLMVGICYLFKKYLSCSITHVFEFRLCEVLGCQWFEYITMYMCLFKPSCYNGLFAKKKYLFLNHTNNASAITVVLRVYFPDPWSFSRLFLGVLHAKIIFLMIVRHCLLS